MKLYNDKKIKKRVFKAGAMVLLCNSRLFLFSRKLKPRWYRQFIVARVFLHGVVEFNRVGKSPFNVNR